MEHSAHINVVVNSQIASDISYSGSLTSTNKWRYTPNIGFEPDYCYLAKVRYYNAGTDTRTYILRSDMFASDVRMNGDIVTEDIYNAQYWSENLHQLRDQSINGNTFEFSIIGADGSSVPSGGTVTVLIMFVKEHKYSKK